MSAIIPDVLALALIVDHWTEMLKEDQALCRCEPASNRGAMWQVLEQDDDNDFIVASYGPTRFHALAEFLVPGSTKEKT